MTDVAEQHDTERQDTVTLTVDGTEIHARPGEMVIAAAERNGIYIPRFCWHPRMKPVGMCRMCLVEIEGMRGLPPSCTTPVADGMVVRLASSPAVQKAQDGVLEFLLINHPLDCPVCDRGGECPLQDQTFSFGPGESRFVEEKRHYAKPIHISGLVDLDRERCVLCARCTRFADELAGDPLISFTHRGNETQVLTFPDNPFTSYFSGNTVQICPVGALLAKPYRFRARPWDLEEVESTCTTCAVGCRMTVQSSTNRLVRYLGVDSDPVNQSWLCDKGRFGFEASNAAARLGGPLMRRSPAERSAVTVQGDGALREVGWAEALERAAEALRSARELHGPDGVGVIGGARLTNEDAYAWTKLAKGVLGTDSVDCQLGDGLAPDLVLGLPRATIADACSAPAVVLLGPDLKEELPVLYLRLRRAALDGATKLVELSPRATGLTPYAAVSVRYRPGEAPDAARAVVTGDTPDADLAAAASIVRGAPGAVVIVGRPSVAEQPGTIADAVAALAALPGVRFLSGLRRGNVHGALDMGMAPGVLPGRVALDDGREWLSRCWPTVPTAKGLDAEGMLVAASEGRLPVLVLLGADPLSDFPDRALARRGIAGAGFVLAVDTTRTPSVEAADVVLAAAGYAEKHGTTTNLEGRVTRLAQKVTPPGTARADWELAVELALRMGEDLGFDRLAALQAEMAVMAPAYAGVTEARLSRPDLRDGVVVPVTQAVPAPQTIEEAATTAGGAASQVTETTEADAVAAQGPTPLPDAVPTAEAPLPESPGAPPPLLKWEAPAAAADPPPVDAYALRLIASRQLYDDGTLVATSGSLAPLVRPLVLQLNRYDLDRLGVGDGGTVRVSSPRGAIEVSVKAADEVPRGAAWMAFNVGDPGAADLIDSTAAVTELRVETP